MGKSFAPLASTPAPLSTSAPVAEELSDQDLYGNACMSDWMCVEPEAPVCEDPGFSLPDFSDVGVCEEPAVEAPVCEQPAFDGIDLTQGGSCPQITEPTTVRSALGDITVYPDDFVGPLPAGAVRASQHERMVSVYDRVASGSSQLRVNTDDFTAGIDPATDPEGYAAAQAQAQAFRDRTMGYLADLVKTDVGLRMVEHMDASKYTTTIQRGTAGSNETGYDDIDAASNGTGSNTTISMNYNLSSFADAGETEDPWMTDRQRFGLYHEMVHATHGLDGTRATGRGAATDVRDGSASTMRNSEFQAVGLGTYANEEFTENKIRAAFGKEQRPHYGHLVPAAAH